MAARGENAREGCEISSLVEHTALSVVALPLAAYNGVSSHSSVPKLIKLVIFSCPY